MDGVMYRYKYKVLNDVGEVCVGELESKCDTWEICRMLEVQLGNEVLEIKKVTPATAFSFLIPPIFSQKGVAYAGA